MDGLRTYRFSGYPVRGQVPLLAYEFRTSANNPASRLATMSGFQLHILCSVINSQDFGAGRFSSQLPQLLFQPSDAGSFSKPQPSICGVVTRNRDLGF
jgi:hypothetical protein